MAIHFSIAKRGLLPQVKTQQEFNEQLDTKALRPILECPQAVDVVDFQSGSLRLPSLMPKGELQAAISTIQRVMVHELEQGNAVSLPGIGTFRLTLKGDIEVKNGNYHGKDVRVESIQFRPDNALLTEVRGFEVEQVPFGQTIQTEEAKVEACLADLFARKDTVTHKDISVAFKQSLTRSRITTLLHNLVKQGRIVSEGKGAQTRYRRLT